MNQSRHLEKLEQFKAYNPSGAELWEARKHEVEEVDMFARRQKIILWLCSLVAAGIMIETLFFKFTGAQESVYIFKKMGTEPWMRWTQGIWELFASNRIIDSADKMGRRHPHYWRDGGSHSQSHDLAGLLDSGRSWTAVHHGVGNVHLRL